MDAIQEVAAARELLSLRASGQRFLRGEVTSRPSSNYTDSSRFAMEHQRVFRRLPHAIAHSSELAGPGGFLSGSYAGVPLLLTRDGNGRVHAFLNACRHRGMRLVGDEQGCARRFTCPYHAWTYDANGELLAAPHFEQGFGELERAELALHRFTCEERFGLVWITLDKENPVALDELLAPVADDLAALALDTLRVAEATAMTQPANWKLLIEGGLEANHFKVAHRNTIGPYFENDLSSYTVLGDHLRSVLPRVSLAEAAEAASAAKANGITEALLADGFRLRDHANLTYWLAPNTQFLVQQDHIVWTQSDPQPPDRTALRLVTLVPKDSARGPEHWARNHKITLRTLGEDFEIGAGIQASAASGIEQRLLFGRFESALDAFNGTVERYLAADAAPPS